MPMAVSAKSMHVRPTLNGRVSRCFRRPGIGIRENWFSMGSHDGDQHAPLSSSTSEITRTPRSHGRFTDGGDPIDHAASAEKRPPWESHELPMDDLLLSIHHSWASET